MNSKQQTYYDLLGVYPGASPIEIRRAYRELSKKYHPDTTKLATAIATIKFQALNEAYAAVSNPERRLAYDLEIGYSRVVVLQPSAFNTLTSRPDNYRSSAYLDPTDRPLSGGEIAALLMLGVTFIGCLILAISIGMIRGEI
jgi:curved DNA-binding protein CbpA